MKIFICQDNIINYEHGNFSDVTEIIWSYINLNESVIKNFPNLEILYYNNYDHKLTSLEPLSLCTNLKILYCDDNKITSLEPLSKCVNLTTLYCGNNKITSLEPLSMCTNLQKLSCYNNNIISLEPLSKCINLQVLVCYYNNITSLDPLSKCINLSELNCSSNQLTSIKPLSHCINLQSLLCNNNELKSLKSLQNNIKIRLLKCAINELTTLDFLSNKNNLEFLDCQCNQINSLEPLSNCINLVKLVCKNNCITSLEPLSNCINLKTLECDNNQVNSLEPLTNHTNLKYIYCNNNRLTSLEPLTNCYNIKRLGFGNNQISSMAPIVNLQYLLEVNYDGNPLDVQSRRFLGLERININTSIYDNKQNIHDIKIQHTVCDSVENLLSDPKPKFSIDTIINSDLNDKTKEALIEYCHDHTFHSVHLTTYIELLSYVWNRIIKSEHQSELKKILEEQIADSECMCFTGRFNRTLSVLVGFYDDIKINISDKSRISAIILNCKDKIIPYNSLLHQEMSRKELINAGYNELEIEPWISAIEEIETIQ